MNTWPIHFAILSFNTHFMKQSILCFALLIVASFGCNKGTELQTTVGQSTGALNDPQPQVSDRFICCCDVIVTSAAFNGLTICGVAGNTCGVQQVVQSPNKNASFCYETNCPICFTNNSILFPIQIRLSCTGGSSGLINIPAGGTVCFLSDCNGNLQPC